MSFTRFLRILNAHAGLVLVTLLLASGAAVMISLALPAEYRSTSSIVVDPGGGFRRWSGEMPGMPQPGYLATQLDVIRSQSVALKVVDELGLAETAAERERYLSRGRVASYGLAALTWQAVEPLHKAVEDLRRSWRQTAEPPADARGEDALKYRLAEQVLERVDLRVTPDSNVIDLTYTAADPEAAAVAADAVARAYIATSLELSVSPARDSSRWFDRQIEQLAGNLEEARARYAAFQAEAGIVASEEAGDVENAQLADLSSQLVAARSHDHPAIQALAADLARAEAELDALPPQLGTNHPEYRRSFETIVRLRARLESESSRLIAQIERQMEQQKGRVLETKADRAQLAALRDDVESAAAALARAQERQAEMRLEGEVEQANVSLLRAAVPALEPSSPDLPRNVAIGVVLGLVLGIGLALWREVTDGRVRCREDLIELVGLPVLATLPRAAALPLLLRRMTPALALEQQGGRRDD